MTLNLAELRRLEAEATPAPWDVSGLTVYDTCMDSVASTHSAADAALIVAMRNALPEMLKALEGWDTEYEVVQDDMVVAGSTSLKEAMHYAALYEADGPVQIIEVRRRPLPPHGGVDVG